MTGESHDDLAIRPFVELWAPAYGAKVAFFSSPPRAERSCHLACLIGR